jgi:hypothetical protein
MRRSDIKDLPCIVFDALELKQEAKGFLGANTLRKPLTGIDKFKALLTIEDDSALLVHNLITRAGYRISSQPTSGEPYIKAVTTLLKYAASNPELLKQIWPLWLLIANGGPLYERVMGATWFIESSLAGSSVSLLKNPWRVAIINLGNKGILDAIARACAFYAKGGERVWASGVIEALNRGRRTNRIKIVSLDIQA